MDFLDQIFLVATSGTSLEPGEHVLGGDVDIGVRGIQAGDGRLLLPVFTSEKCLVEWAPAGSPWIGLSGRDALHLLIAGEWETVIIDPAGLSTEISRFEAQQLLNGQ